MPHEPRPAPTSTATLTPTPALTLLRADGVALVLDHRHEGLPSVLHWGADLGPLGDGDLLALAASVGRQTPPGTLDAAWSATLLPQEADGWTGRPGVQLARDGVVVFPRWTTEQVDHDGRSLVVTAVAPSVGAALCSRLTIETGGLVSLTHEITSTVPGLLDVQWLEATLPAPKSVTHQTDFSGRWTREKTPSTVRAPRGSVARQTRRGRSGHDSPTALIASVGRPADRHGELWSVHLGWSADCTYRSDRLTDSVHVIGAGELVRPGEIRLAEGESYATPVAYFAFSDAGLDGMAARFHTYLRSRPQHPRSPRPLVLNTWEAVYFDHDPAFLGSLAALAAEVGVERFVLDDGWFMSRRDDTTGLGDWLVDPAVWPEGLGPLAAQVHGLGMELGLWFEPEMVNLDSDLAREHPDWLLHHPDHVPAPAHLSWRSQYVLDIANPGAYDHVFGQIDALVTELGIDFIKWDHNRDLVESMHDGRPGTHAQTHALYRLVAELKAAHPGLEIESCSSGGARTDLGILAVTDRVWASDSNDPVERQDIQRWTQLLLPPELVGGHVGPTTAHSSGRTTDLSFRLATSLMGSAGFEWDISGCTPEERATISRWAKLYKELRPLIHSGTAVHADPQDPALRVVGAVAEDQREAVFTIASVATLEDALPERIRLHGLDPDRRYVLTVRDEIGEARHGFATPPWLAEGGLSLTGRVLSTVGLQVPPFWPAQAVVLHLVSDD